MVIVIILAFETGCKDGGSDYTNDVTKYMLVLMVRVVTGLKFSLAGFATASVISEFLYPIVLESHSNSGDQDCSTQEYCF